MKNLFKTAVFVVGYIIGLFVACLLAGGMMGIMVVVAIKIIEFFYK